MSQDNIRLYEQLLKEAQKAEKEAVESKKWTEVAKIRAKKAELEDKINRFV